MKIGDIFILVIILILISISVSATGMSGSDLRAKVRFKPNMKYGFSYTLNADNFDNSYTVFSKGSLSEYVEFETTRIEDVPAGTKVPFRGVINLPDSLSPGWHRVDICVLEDCRSKATVCGRAGVCAIIEFQVLHEGIKPELRSFKGHNVNENQPVTFKAEIENIGKENITRLTGKVEVYNQQRQLVGSAVFDEIWLAGGAKNTIEAVFDTQGLPAADYSATAFITADDVELQGNTSFKIGHMDVEITDYTKEIAVGGIKRFLVTAKSNWNDPIPIFSDVRISNGDVSTSARTATVSLPPWETAVTEAYIDTSDLEPGEYDLKINMHYADEKKTVEDTITLTRGGVEEAAVEEKEMIEEAAQSSSVLMITILLVIIVVLLTILNVFLVIRRKKGKKGDDGW